MLLFVKGQWRRPVLNGRFYFTLLGGRSRAGFLFSSCAFSSDFVSSIFVLVELSLTLSLSWNGAKTVSFCSVTAGWKIKDCEQCSKPVMIAKSAQQLVSSCGGLSSDFSGSLKRLFLTST